MTLYSACYEQSPVFPITSGRMYNVSVGHTNDDPRIFPPSLGTYTVCGFLSKVLTNAELAAVTCHTNNSHRYVLIQHVGSLNHTLELCEVQVFGTCE
jgi:hypothetical protein